ncbi:hypothetical protein [Sphingobacterium kitahiroshimense]|uniref:hypothetical protein n=1 Tax=Sphingobacterium kitahiroshimense TaxID=470446 RepID=UPI00320A3BC5
MIITINFLSNVKTARKHINLSETDLDNLLKEYGLNYSELENKSKKIVSVELAYRIAQVFNRNIEEFITDDFRPFDLITTNIKTQEYIQLSLKANSNQNIITKFLNAYVIIVIKNFKKGTLFTNSDIIPNLPPNLNQGSSIDWTAGLLKGLVTNTNSFRKSVQDNDPKNRGEAIYQLNDQVPKDVIDKALKKVDPFWLNKFNQKAKKNS